MEAKAGLVRKDRGNEDLDASSLDLIVRRMRNFGSLSARECALIRDCGGPRDHMPSSSILAEGQTLVPLWFASGWACRQRSLADGRRQIVNFILPGDAIGMNAHPATTVAWSVVALTAVRTYDGSPVASALHGPDTQGLTKALLLQRDEEDAILCEQIVRLGRRSAFERVSHLLIELNTRLRKVGLAEGNRFELPLTQEILADAVGLSVVHVNRTLQQMRREGVVELRHGYVTVLEPGEMRAIAEAEAF